MTIHIDKIASVKKMAHERDALMQIVEILERIGNIEAAEAEARARLAKVCDEKTTTRQAVIAATNELESINAKTQEAKTQLQAVRDDDVSARRELNAACVQLENVRAEVTQAQAQLKGLREAIEQFTGNVRRVETPVTP